MHIYTICPFSPFPFSFLSFFVEPIPLLSPTTLLGATCAPLNHCFIHRIFLEFFKYVFQKNINFLKKILNTVMLRYIFLNIPKYVTKKYFQIVFLVSKLF